MKIDIPKVGIIKEQKVEFREDVNIIYGYNNSGKTSILKVINDIFYTRVKEQFLLGEKSELAVYIPTNRIVLSHAKTENVLLQDIEEFIHYQLDTYKDYALHLKRLRDSLMLNDIVYRFICQVIETIFGIDISESKKRWSDGIENIINIYLGIIWSILWNIDINNLTEEKFREIIINENRIVLIDEIEMFLHVNIQEKLIGCLKADFKNCKFIFTTHSPLLLTRYKEACIYEIKDGRLEQIEEDVYYEDLDVVYEELFGVKELPQNIKADMDYLWNVVMKREEYDSIKIKAIIEKIKQEYPKLSIKYNKLIAKALFAGEENG